MGETPKFFLLISVATIPAAIFLLRARSAAISRSMARGFYQLCIILSTAALVLSILSPFQLWQGELYARVFRILIFRGWIIAGTAIAAAGFILLGAAGVAKSRLNSLAIREFVTSPYLLNGLCISVAVSFICTEIGKLNHDAEMRLFFLQSGYAVWFLYFVITCEIVGSIGLLIQRTRLAAAACLSLLMLGALRTHAHNGDPFSDSLEAVHLLILLVCIIVLRFAGRYAVISFRKSPQAAKQS